MANTEDYYKASLRNYESRFGSTDAEVFRWQIGNWEYPAGLFPSASPEQRAFDLDWDEFAKPLAHVAKDENQEKIESLCLNVLKRLVDDGVFLRAANVRGYTILGPDDGDEFLLGKKGCISRFLNS